MVETKNIRCSQNNHVTWKKAKVIITQYGSTSVLPGELAYYRLGFLIKCGKELHNPYDT